jgi:sec-independent protein translocase protein TatA
MFGLGIPELLLILVAVIFLFGGSKLPQLGKALGETIGSFRKALREKSDQDQPDPGKKTGTR